MNPRVSRSSALASKATGYPIAKVAARLAVGYTLDEIPNDLDGHDAGELRADARLRRRQVAALRVREVPRRRPDARHADEVGRRVDGHRPHVRRGVRQGAPRARDRPGLAAGGPAPLVRGASSSAPAARRRAGRLPPRRLVRRRGRGAPRTTSTRPAASATRRRPEPGRSVVILGSGPNRIGQGIEFDYCCVHAAASFRAQGYEAVMVNCNPETVSTDYDTSDRLYFEPLDEEAVLAVLEREQPVGRLHPVRRADAAQARARDRAGRLPDPRHAVRRDRPRRGPRAVRPARREPRGPLPGVGDRRDRRRGGRDRRRGSATRCSCGRRTCSAGARCGSATTEADVRAAMAAVDGAVLVDRFLENAIELDVDALCDGTRDLRRRGDGARRGGGHPLGRLLVRAARAVRLGRESASSSAGSGPRSASSGSSTSSSRSRAARSTCSR